MQPAPLPSTLRIKSRDPVPYAFAPERFVVDDAHVKWDTPLDYNPPYFSSPYFTWPGMRENAYLLLEEDRALTAQNFQDFKFNSLDHNGRIDSRSHHGPYELLDGIFPRNQAGRTGLRGRGYLKRWGPNHTSRSIVTRWIRDSSGNKVQHSQTNLPMLEFVCYECDYEWRIPGVCWHLGSVGPGQFVTCLLHAKFIMALGFVFADETTYAIEKRTKEAFANNQEVYRGYWDSKENTDNAWWEIVVFNFHDEAGNGLGAANFKPEDDLRWMKLSGYLKLNAEDIDFVKQVANKHNAHW